MRKVLALLLSMVLLFSIVLGCSQEVIDNEKKVLKVYSSIHNDEALWEIYLQEFEILRPDVQIQFVPDSFRSNPSAPYKTYYERTVEAITGPEQADVIFLTDPISPLIKEGLLLPLDPFIHKYEYNLDGIEPSILKILRQMGNDTIYFLPTEFATFALFYNKDLFDQYGVEYPTDYMTWEEVFNLARQFNSEEDEDKIYGFDFLSEEDLLSSMEIFAAPMEIYLYSGDLTSMTVNTPEWEKVWNVFVELIHDEVMPMPSQYPNDPYDFLNGNVAMCVMPSIWFWVLEKINDLEKRTNPNEDYFDQFAKFNWDVVTMPTHQEYPNKGGLLMFSGTVGIGVNAQNPELAWEFISFFTGEKMSKIRAQTSPLFSVRFQDTLVANHPHFNVSAFTKVEPVYRELLDSDIDVVYPQLNKELGQIYRAFLHEFEAALNRKKTIKEALQDLEESGNQVLMRLSND